MTGRALLAGVLLALVLPSSARAEDACPASAIDVADWPVVRSPRLPGFTLRLPRAFTRDAAAAAAHWTAASRARLTIAHRAPGAASPALPSADGRTDYVRCEARIGAATATIVSFAQGPDTSGFLVDARLQWPDGEELHLRADAADREHLAQLLTAVRTIRRAGA
jgi:hypothetical protein